MRGARTAALIVGILAALIGLLWAGQGSGYFRYPQSSSMIGQTMWLQRGAILFVAGLVIAGLSPWIGR